MMKTAAPVLALAALVLVSCSDGAERRPETVARDVTPSVSATVTVPASTAQDAGDTIEVEVRGGKLVKAPGTVDVQRGEHVTLTVTADVADEVHLHGYDLSVEAVPGRQATLEFLADIPGRFEAELENVHMTLVEFQVR